MNRLPRSMPARLASLALVFGVLVGCAAASALAIRRPTHAERRAILAGIPKAPNLHQRCLRYKVRVSTVNPRYAYVAYEFPTPIPHGCATFNGASVMKRRADGRWRQVYAGSLFYCDGAVPGRVIREFFKTCTYGQSSHFYSPSGNLECVFRTHPTALACVAFNSGRSAYLYASGRLRLRGPPPASFFHRRPGIVLPYGQIWHCARGSSCPSHENFYCESLETGMRCGRTAVFGHEHGFLIARQGIHRF